MTKLNQIVAVEKGVKGKAERAFTKTYQLLEKPAPLNGISRTYAPKDDDGDRLPPESTLVQVKAEDEINKVSTELTRLFDVVLTKDVANTVAKANVTVDGEVLLSDVPVPYLLFLEKQLVDIRTFVSKLPTLDPSERWTHDTTSGVWATEPSGTTRTKKIPRNHIKYEATKEHAAQVDVYHEDVVVGIWTTTKFSGALPQDRVNEMLERVDKLTTAVKFAREEANSTEVTDRQAGAAVFGYLFS